jgi:hypothetical protein
LRHVRASMARKGDDDSPNNDDDEEEMGFGGTGVWLGMDHDRMSGEMPPRASDILSSFAAFQAEIKAVKMGQRATPREMEIGGRRLDVSVDARPGN